MNDIQGKDTKSSTDNLVHGTLGTLDKVGIDKSANVNNIWSCFNHFQHGVAILDILFCGK